jgi:hypothetical protein
MKKIVISASSVLLDFLLFNCFSNQADKHPCKGAKRYMIVPALPATRLMVMGTTDEPYTCKNKVGVGR